MKNGSVLNHTEKNGKQIKNRAKMCNKRCISNTYSAVIRLVKQHHLFCFTLSVFLADLLDSPFRFFV